MNLRLSLDESVARGLAKEVDEARERSKFEFAHVKNSELDGRLEPVTSASYLTLSEKLARTSQGNPTRGLDNSIDNCYINPHPLVAWDHRPTTTATTKLASQGEAESPIVGFLKTNETDGQLPILWTEFVQ